MEADANHKSEEELKLDSHSAEKGSKVHGSVSNQSEGKPLTFELVSQCFSMPIKQAAKELNVGLTLLKKTCRDLDIPRWPHRKMKSLDTLIKNVQELGKDSGEEGRSLVQNLQQTKKLIQERPGSVVLDDKMKILRQKCFKENYKRRRLMVLDA